MKYQIELIKNMANDLVKEKLTIRQVAKKYNKSKSTVHKWFKERLIYIDNNLYLEVEKILNYNKNIRHIRGGEATKLKYKKK